MANALVSNLFILKKKLLFCYKVRVPADGKIFFLTQTEGVPCDLRFASVAKSSNISYLGPSKPWEAAVFRAEKFQNWKRLFEFHIYWTVFHIYWTRSKLVLRPTEVLTSSHFSDTDRRKTRRAFAGCPQNFIQWVLMQNWQKEEHRSK